MKKKHSKQYYRNHLNYLQNRYKSLERQLEQAYADDDRKAIDYYEVRLCFALDELNDAKADYIKNT